MSKELWATYSVRDHLAPRSLAVDMMLYDRLVFPVPYVWEYQPTDAGTGDSFAWIRNDDEWDRWRNAGWDPEAQTELLELIAPVIRRMPWSSVGQMDEAYRAEEARLAKRGIDDAFVITRSFLTQDLPAYVEGVAAFGPAYRTFDEFHGQTGGHRPARQLLDGQVVANVIAGEHIVPDVKDPRLSDAAFLKETATFIAGDEDFRRKRTAFIDWCQTFTREGKSDEESIRRAMQEMSDLLSDANNAARRLTVRVATRFFFQLAPAAAAIVAAAAGHELLFAFGGAFLSLGSFAVDAKLFPESEQGASLPAAFVQDAARHFGWQRS